MAPAMTMFRVETRRRTRGFWCSVDKLGPVPSHRPELGRCWIWRRARKPGGYGNVRRNRRWWNTHRFAYTLSRGPIPDGLLVLHRCDNPACVRPSHLFLGTQLDNARDASAKGRMHFGAENGMRKHPERQAQRLHPNLVRRGEEVGTARLTADEVLAIRAAHERGRTITEIARQRGKPRSTIVAIVYRRTWAHLPQAAEAEVSSCGAQRLATPSKMPERP